MFLGRPLCGLSLTSPVIWNMAFRLEMVLGLSPNNAATWFCGTPASSCPISRALSRHADSWSRHQLTCSQVPDWYLIGSVWEYQKLKTRDNSNSKISCLALAEKFYQIFHGCNPHTHLCCSSHKCMFLTNVAPFKMEINRLSNSIRFIAMKHCYNKEILYQTQISLLFVFSFTAVSLAAWFGATTPKSMETTF